MVSLNNIYWLAAYLEGEGCFSIHKKTYKRKSGYRTMMTPIITASSVDRDVIEKVATLFGSPICTQSLRVMRNAGGNSRSHSTKIYSSRAIGWMMTLYPLLSIRRKRKIKDIIEVWKVEYRRNSPLKPLNTQGSRVL